MKKMVTWITVLGLALSLAACGKDAENKEEAGIKTVQEESDVIESEEEESKEENNAYADASDFSYSYEAAIEGLVITGYTGEAEVIQIPAQIDGEPVRMIGYRAFLKCSSLKEVSIPASVTEIHDNAFAECSSLTEISIPDGVTAIGNGAFAHCSGLTDVYIPDSIMSIHEGAFERCDSLRNLTVPDSVTLIYPGAFAECPGLKVTYQGQEYTYANDPADWWG